MRDPGYLLHPNLIPDFARFRDYFMDLRSEGTKPGDEGGNNDDPQDPLNKFPRMLNMHAWDETAMNFVYDPRLAQAAQDALGAEPVLIQSMVYFKPPGARGQAWHQDQQFITWEPLVGVWVALDDCDLANGQLRVIPGEEREVLLMQKDDPRLSFTQGQALLRRPSPGIGLTMQAGDAVVFGGRLVHGSYPNRTSDRWRRSFICHYTSKTGAEFVPKHGTHIYHLRGW